MKPRIRVLLLALFLVYAIYTHYLSFLRAKQLVYADLDPSEIRNGSGQYNVKKVAVDSIRYHKQRATIYYRLTATYSNGSIKDAQEVQYDNEPTHLEVRHGLLGWVND